MTTQPLPTPDQGERIIHAALEAGDMPGVVAALTVMAPQDPERAQRLYDAIQLGIAFVRDGGVAP